MDERKAVAEHRDERGRAARPGPVGSGNPRVTIAFPFSRIQLAEPAPELRELAGLVRGLAEQAAALAGAAAPDQAAAAAELAEQAGALAARLGAA